KSRGGRHAPPPAQSVGRGSPDSVHAARAHVAGAHAGPGLLVLALPVAPAAPDVVLDLVEGASRVVRIAAGDVADTVAYPRVLVVEARGGVALPVRAVVLVVLVDVLRRAPRLLPGPPPAHGARDAAQDGAHRARRGADGRSGQRA